MAVLPHRQRLRILAPQAYLAAAPGGTTYTYVALWSAQLVRYVLGIRAEEFDQLLCVGGGVVRVAVVHQHVSLGRLVAQFAQLRSPVLELARRVFVAELLVDVLTCPFLAVPGVADHAQIGGYPAHRV